MRRLVGGNVWTEKNLFGNLFGCTHLKLETFTTSPDKVSEKHRPLFSVLFEGTIAGHCGVESWKATVHRLTPPTHPEQAAQTSETSGCHSLRHLAWAGARKQQTMRGHPEPTYQSQALDDRIPPTLSLNSHEGRPFGCVSPIWPGRHFFFLSGGSKIFPVWGERRVPKRVAAHHAMGYALRPLRIVS